MRLTLTTFLTLDGVMQAPGQPGEDSRDGFGHGGWQVPYVDEEAFATVSRQLADADGILLGRTTYEIFADYWPHVTDRHDRIARRLNTLPKYVASTTLENLTWHNSSLIGKDVPGEVARLKAEPGGELQVHGSGRLAATLMAHDLVDEYRLWIHPVLLGEGRRLFDDGVVARLRPVEVRTTGSGVILATYLPAGTPGYGGAAPAGSRGDS